VTTPAPVTDGRSARSKRTREAVVDALLALICEGNPRPTARQIADRANISLRSVYVHFDDLEDLFLAVAQRQMATIAKVVTPIDTDAPLADRIDAMCTMRARIFEDVGPVRRAAELQAPFSPTLSGLLTGVRKTSREGLATVFAPELAALPADTRARRIAALDAVLSGESWDLLRGVHALSFDDARETMVEAATVLLSGDAR
jgi:TetR/AcrR family transcriptional regulator, regulator of autoinduction and epiphytic fitness